MTIDRSETKKFTAQDIAAVATRSSSIQEICLSGDLCLPPSWVFPHLQKLSGENVSEDLLEAVAVSLEQGQLSELRVLDLEPHIFQESLVVQRLCSAIIHGPPTLRLQKFRLPSDTGDPALFSSLLRCPALSKVEELDLRAMYGDADEHSLADAFHGGVFRHHLHTLRVNLGRYRDDAPSVRFFRALNCGAYSSLRVLEVHTSYRFEDFGALSKFFTPRLGIETLKLGKIEVEGAEGLCEALESGALPRLKKVTTQHQRMKRDAVERLIKCLRNQKVTKNLMGRA